MTVAAAFATSDAIDPAGSASASSSTMPKGNVVSNGKTWTPVVSQDFSTPAARGTFAAKYSSSVAGYSGFKDTSGVGVYKPSAVLSVANGNLDWYLHSENGVPQVATVLPTGYTGQTYGRYAIKFRTDAVAGYKMAFMLWPTSDDWNDGEIDWPDGNLGGNAYPASAVAGSYSASKGMTFDGPDHSTAFTMGTGWHTAVTEWTKGKVRWYWDGKLAGQTTKASGVPTTPMRWTLQVETNTNQQKVAASAAGHVQVAWYVQYR